MNDMNSEVHLCSIGILKEEIKCRKLSISKSKTLKFFSSLLIDDEEKLLHRTNLLDKKEEVNTVCGHHKSLLIDRYEVLQKTCCNPFNTHKSIKLNLQEEKHQN